MKKALAILVAVMLMATVCMTASAGAVSMAFGAVEVEEGTATVDVPLNITANEGIFGFIVDVTFDPAVVEFAKATKGDAFNVLPNADKAAEGTVKLVIDAAEVANVTSTGVAATLTFNVKGAAGATSDIVATLPDAESNIDVDGENVDLTVANGSVKVNAKAAPITTTKKDTAPTKGDVAPTAPAVTAAPTATTAPAAPATGSAIPAAAIVLAAASAAVLTFARKK